MYSILFQNDFAHSISQQEFMYLTMDGTQSFIKMINQNNHNFFKKRFFSEFGLEISSSLPLW